LRDVGSKSRVIENWEAPRELVIDSELKLTSGVARAVSSAVSHLRFLIRVIDVLRIDSLIAFTVLGGVLALSVPPRAGQHECLPSSAVFSQSLARQKTKV
jgi:hypothetical protein